jgi:peroxiredoxin
VRETERIKKNKVLEAMLLSFAMAVGACGSGSSARGASLEPPGTVEDTSHAAITTPAAGNFSLKDVDGNTHRLSDYLGRQVVVLSFFATWCEPCKIELMELRDYYREHRDGGFTVLAISIDEPETQGDVRSFAKQRRFDFPILLDTELEASGLFNPKREAPYVVVIDKAAMVCWTHSGYLPGDGQRLQSVIRAAVGQQLE